MPEFRPKLARRGPPGPPGPQGPAGPPGGPGGGGAAFPLTADVSAATHRITDLGAPTAAGDAARRSYVDATASAEADAAQAAAEAYAAAQASAALASALAADLTLGTNPGQALPGNHASVTNARAPTGAAGGGLSGSYPNPDVAVVGTATSTTQHRGASRLADIESVTGTATLSATATQHDCALTGPATLSLPTAASVGDVHVVQDVSGNFGTHNATMQVQGGGTINGAATHVLNTNWAGRSFRKTGATAWVTPQ